MTRSELRELTRFYLDELGTARIKDSDSDEYDLNQALFAALERYFRKTRCSLVHYTLAATPGQEIYAYGVFGLHAASPEAISIEDVAADADDFLLTSPVEPVDYITVTFKNTTGAAAVGTATVVAVVGTDADGVGQTENLTFTAADLTLEDGKSYTKTTTATFGSLTSITPSVAQAALTWLHSAGISTNPEKYSALDVADDTDAFILIANMEPVRYVTVSIGNPTGADLLELARTYTIVGTREGGIPCTEVVTATAQTLGAGLIDTIVSTQAFASVSKISPNLAQTAGLEHSAGVGVEDAGKRIFDLSYVAYNERPLARRERDWMDGRSPKWRFSGNGTPSVWIPWGDKQFRVWHPPSASDEIYIEGWETPDSRCFDDDTQEPPVESTEQEILAMDAAILVTIRDSRDEQLVRQTALWSQRNEGWARAYARIHGAGDRSIIFGRGNSATGSDFPPYADGITNI